MLKKKVLALALALALCLSVMPVLPAMAEEAALPTFQSYLHDSFNDFIETARTADLVPKQLSARNSGAMNLTLTLGDVGRAFLSMMVPIDLAPLKSVGLTTEALIDDAEYAKFIAQVNGVDIASLLFYMDLATMDFAMAAPELSPVALGGNYKELITTSTQNMGEEEAAAMLGFYNGYMSTLTAMMNGDFEINPEGKDHALNFISRYVNLIIDVFENAGSEEATITVNGVSQDVTQLSGAVALQDLIPALQNALEVTKTDDDLKYFLDLIVASGNNVVTVNGEEITVDFDTYVSSVDELIASLDENAEQFAEEDGGIIAVLSIDADGNCVAQEYNAYDNGETMPLSSNYRLVADNTVATEMNVGFGDQSFTLSGLGTLTDGILDGEYTVSLSGATLATISVIGLNENKDGNSAGTFVIKPYQPAEGEQGSPFADILSFISSFDLTLSYNGNEEATNTEISVNASGSPLFTLTLNGETKDVEPFDTALFADPVNILDEEALNAFAESIDPTQVLANLESAGITMEYIGGLISAFSGEAAAE